MLAETQEDIAAALCYCDSALGCLKEAMAQKDLNSKALTYVQKKHNSCLLKSRSLQKRMPARQESLQSSGSSDMPPSVGNRSSITSSDSDMSDNLAKQLRMEAARERQDVRNRGYTSQDSIGNLHDRQGSGTHLGAPNAGRQGQVMNGAPYSGGPRNSPSRSGQENGIAHQRTDSGGVSRMSTSQSANCFQGGSSSGGDSSGSTADLYGTLPRNKSRKPSSETAASPEVYQSFLNKQKCLQAGVHASQQSLDSVKSDSGGSDHGSAAGNQQRMSKSDIRQLLQDNIVQRQWQQNVLVVNFRLHPQAYYSDDEERLGSHVSYSDNELDDVEDNNSSNSDDSPVGDEEACQLCHKRRTDLGKLFCAKCSFYMSRLKSN
nr:hypothetical protein BaRGS_023152 [Batillaria attramentaria]